MKSLRSAGASLALLGGFVAGNFGRDLMPWWSLETGYPSLFPATFAAIAAGLATLWLAESGRRTAAMPVTWLTLIGVSWWLTPPIQSPMTRVGLLIGLAVASVGNWELLRRIWSPNLGRLAAPALGTIWGGAAASVLIHAHSARFCDLAVLMAASLIGVGIVTSYRNLELNCVWPAPSLFYPGLMVSAPLYTFSEVPTASFVLVGLAPCALTTLWIPGIRNRSQWSPRAAAVAALTIPCVIAVWLAMNAESIEFGENL
jgi:hypothetical protein